MEKDNLDAEKKKMKAIFLSPEFNKLFDSEDISDIVDGDKELEGYNKGWRVGYKMGVLEAFRDIYKSKKDNK